MNTGGLIVIALGLFILVVAIRGTQSQVFPFAFAQSGSQQTPVVPNPGNTNCYTMVNGMCPCPGWFPDPIAPGKCTTIGLF